MSCPQPKGCACGKPLPAREKGRGGRNRKHCDACRAKRKRDRVRQWKHGGCPECPHCRQVAARAELLEEVARTLEAGEWRSAAATVRAMARRNPPEEARGAARQGLTP